MTIETMSFNTEAEAKAYIAGVSALSDMVLDYAQRSIQTSEPILNNGKFTVSVFEELDEDEDIDEEE